MRAFNSRRSSGAGVSGTRAHACVVQATPPSWRSNSTIRVDGSCMHSLDSLRRAMLQPYPKPARSSIPERGKAGEVVGEDFDVFFRQRLCRRAHIAVEFATRARFETAQLCLEIGELLAGQARNVLQPQERRTMALHAIELLRELRPGGGVLRRGLVRRGGRSLLGEVRGKLVHVRIG